MKKMRKLTKTLVVIGIILGIFLVASILTVIVVGFIEGYHQTG